MRRRLLLLLLLLKKSGIWVRVRERIGVGMRDIGIGMGERVVVWLLRKREGVTRALLLL